MEVLWTSMEDMIIFNESTAEQLFGYEQVAKRIANIRLITERKGWKKDEENKNVYGSRSVYESFDIIRM